MAEFEELKLTVNLVDNASAGLANIRAQITGLTQTTTQMGQAFASATAQTQQLGSAVARTHPQVRTLDDQMKSLTKSAEETGRGMLQMVLAARGGIGSLPQLALGLREAQTGLVGVNEGMTALAPASRLAVVGLSSVAVGVAAVGAAVVAYGISVFKFSQEMYTLSQTAKALGMTFGQLRSITEQNERFGISAENTAGQLARVNDALTDLTLSGSRLRQSLLSQGVPPQWIDSYTKLTNEVDRYNARLEAQTKIRDDWIRRGVSPEVAATIAGRFQTALGGDPNSIARGRMEQPTAAELAQSKLIEEQSKQIAAQWRDISKSATEIKTAILAWGLPGIITALGNIEGIFNRISQTVSTINSGIQSASKSFLRFYGYDLDKMTDEEKAKALGLGPPEAPPTQLHSPRSALGALKHPSSYTTGANDNVNPLLHNVSYGDGFGGGGSDEGRAQAIIKGGVYDALVDFFGLLQGGGAKGGGGFQTASFGGSAGAARGGGASAADFGSKQFPNLATGGNRAGRAGRVGGGGGDGGPGGEGDTTPPSGNLAAQRAGFMKELDADPHLKAYAIDAMQHEGGIQSNMEQLFNYAAMRHMTIRQALHSGQYGPVNRGQITGNISGRTRAQGEDALQKVGAGSNITDYATDQGMAGDPNYAKYQSNPSYWHMHKVQGAWFSAHGERGRKWAEQQRATDAASAAKSNDDTDKSRAASTGRTWLVEPGAGIGGSTRVRPRPSIEDAIKDTAPAPDEGLDRSLLNSSEVKHTGKLDVSVNAPPGTKVNYNGNGLLKNTSMQRQTQMMPTDTGPNVSDTARSYMRGGN